VDKHIEMCPTEVLANLVKIREINPRVIASGDVMFAAIFARQRCPEPSTPADNQNFHLLRKRVVRNAAQRRRTPKSAVRNPQSTINIFPRAPTQAATRMDWRRTTESFPASRP